jgi:hypothetical protein
MLARGFSSPQSFRHILAGLFRYIETNIHTLFSLEMVGVVELLSGDLK